MSQAEVNWERSAHYKLLIIATGKKKINKKITKNILLNSQRGKRGTPSKTISRVGKADRTSFLYIGSIRGI